jgi:predicted HD phosphohydrolase
VTRADEYPTPQAVLTLLRLLGGCYAADERGRVDTLTHSLQAATRAERGGADDALVAAALCHDMGKLFSVAQHDRVGAQLLSGFVPPPVVQVVRHHVHLTASHWDAGQRGQRTRYRRAAWYAVAAEFVDDWDVPSFDPGYPTEPLEHFEPLVDEVFAQKRWPEPKRLPAPLEPWRAHIDTVRRLGGWG